MNSKEKTNEIALIALLCGIISMVPFVAIMAVPLTFIFAIWALLRSRKRRYNGTIAAFYGVIFASISILIQIIVISIGSQVGVFLRNF